MPTPQNGHTHSNKLFQSLSVLNSSQYFKWKNKPFRNNGDKTFLNTYQVDLAWKLVFTVAQPYH